MKKLMTDRRRKGWLGAVLLAVFLIPFMAAGPVRAEDAYGWPSFDEVQVESFCVIDAETGREILSKDPDKKRPNASTTKIMTALVLVEDKHYDPELLLTVSDKSLFFLDPNSARIQGLQEGDQLATEDCLAALLIASANDIARVIAQNFGGAYGAVDPNRRGDAAASQELFVQRMNERAAELGAESTHFTNPAGFDEPDMSHYTTARDIALIAAEAMKNPQIARIVSLPYYRMKPTPVHPEAWWATMGNSNALVLYGTDYFQSHYYQKYTGVKTGTTPQAGKCLVGSGITGDGRHFVCAALGIEPVDMKNTPFLARAIPVRTILEEAARREGVPEKEPADMLALPLELEETSPTESQELEVKEPADPAETTGEDPFFTAGVGTTKPIILVLAALGALTVVGLIVAAIIVLLFWLKRLKARRGEEA